MNVLNKWTYIASCWAAWPQLIISLLQVVGLLLRARKYKLVEFEGETLFQGRDDKTPIYLLRWAVKYYIGWPVYFFSWNSHWIQ